MRARTIAVALLALGGATADAQQVTRRPLAPADIDDIARLVMMEDRRDFDAESLARLLASAHPEVRRRAAVTVGRIADPRGRGLARRAAGDPDTAVAASAVFSIGQLKDSGAVAWLDSLLRSPATPVAVAREAAGALGKIKSSDARSSLARFLAEAPDAARMSPVVGEALLSIGRMPVRGDIAPIVRWATAPDVEVRWRATWALFRPRDPASVPHLLRLSSDPSALVRSWAVRGLGAPQADSSGAGREKTAARLHAAARDTDRRVRTEAIRALGSYADSATVDVLLRTLESRDSWLSVSAAEALGRMRGHEVAVVPRLIAATGKDRPRALRITATQSLLALSPDAAAGPAAALASDGAVTSRLAALQVAAQQGSEGARVADLLAADRDPEVRARAKRVRDAIAGTTDSSTRERPSRNTARPIETGLTLADYRRIVERWVVPDYNGAAAPVSRWVTSRGTIDIELYPGDAPLAVDDFVRSVRSGAPAGVEFIRVVPDFVDQQRGMRIDRILRDEVNRRRLTRGNLSWASAGLDTGIPGYTLGITPQPHNEGDFTSLGRVVRGMEVVDRMELGDRVVSTRMVR